MAFLAPVVTAIKAAWAVIGVYATIASIVIQQVGAAKARSRAARAQREAEAAADRAKGTKMVVVGEISPLKVLYGENLVGGSKVYTKTVNSFGSWPANPNAQIFKASDALSHVIEVVNPEPETPTSCIAYCVIPGAYTSEALNSDLTYTRPTLLTTEGIASVPPPSTSKARNIIDDVQDSDCLKVVYVPAHTYTWSRTLPVKDNSKCFLVQRKGTINGNSINWGPVEYCRVTSNGWHTKPIDTGGGWTYFTTPDPHWSLLGSKHEFLLSQQAICFGGINKCYAVDIDERPIEGEYQDANGKVVYPTDTNALPAGVTYVPHYDYGALVYVNLDGNINEPMIVRHDTTRSTALFTGVAYASCVFRLNRDEPQFSGPPAAQFYVEGQKVRDILDEYTISTTKSYSNNPALCLLDYLLDTNYGCCLSVDSIDIPSFIRAKHICDKVVKTGVVAEGRIQRAKGTTRNIKLYECNIALDSSKPLRDNIELILNTMGMAELVWCGGKYKLNLIYPELYDQNKTYNLYDMVQTGTGTDVRVLESKTSSNNTTIDSPNWRDAIAAYITDSDIIRSGEITASWPNAQSRFNYATVRFLNSAKDFAEDTVSWPPKHPTSGDVYAIYLAEDNGILLETDTFADGITTYTHALAHAEQLVRISRSSVNYTISVSRDYLHVEPGDLVKVESAVLNIPGELMRTEEVAAEQDGSVKLTLVKFDVRMLAWNANDDEVIDGRNVYNGQLPNVALSSIVFKPSLDGKTAGTLVWSPVKDNRVTGYQIKTASLYAQDATIWADRGVASSCVFELPLIASGATVVTVVSTDGKKTAPRAGWPIKHLDIDAVVVSPVMAELSKTTIMVPQDTRGNLTYTDVSGVFRVWQGDTILTETADVAFSVVSTVSCTVTINNTTGVGKGVYTVTSLNSKNGQATFKAVYKSTEFVRTLTIIAKESLYPPGDDYPPTPANFTVESAITHVFAEHSQPTFTTNGGYKSTHIYTAERLPNASAPTFAQAVEVMNAAQNAFAIPCNPGTNLYVWAKFEGQDGRLSQVPAAGSTMSGVDVSKLLDVLEGEINKTQLAQELASEINSKVDNGTFATYETNQASIITNLKTETSGAVLQVSSKVNELAGQYTVKIQSNGLVSGFGLASTAPDLAVGSPGHSEFIVNADTFAIGKPYDINGNGTVKTVHPFIVRSSDSYATDGSLIPAGVYMSDTFIANGTITNAKIGKLAVDNSKIANLSVDTFKLQGVAVTVPLVSVSDVRYEGTGLNENYDEAIQINFGKIWLNEPGIVYAHVIAQQWYGKNMRYSHLFIGLQDSQGRVQRSIEGGGAIVPSPVVAAAMLCSPGWVEVSVRWTGADNSVHINKSTLFIMGAKK